MQYINQKLCNNKKQKIKFNINVNQMKVNNK